MRQCDHCGTYEEALEKIYHPGEQEYWWLCEGCMRHSSEILSISNDCDHEYQRVHISEEGATVEIAICIRCGAERA